MYVDDIIVTENDAAERESLKKRLAQEFEIKEFKKLKYFLGIEVAYLKKDIFISQRKYVLDLLKEIRNLCSKAVSTPIDYNHRIRRTEEGSSVDKERYQKLIGRLIYLSHTRPDIAYSVSVVNQFMHDPKEEYLQAIYRILHYLKATSGKGILFQKRGELTLESYTDADYAGL